ncbi:MULTISPECIES: hypothetical protein [Bacillus cereus group]|uniref:Uncharacterized protein n=1 Tax=Bacillus thuringiensis TaxID=1428 RepID=A0A9X6THB2_BACTU|nr:hypothetical protein [Bacillus thuringiensis]MCC2507628.1 hypothetical protein [Bacillus cereus]WIK98622.1 hypothetical protein QPL86_28015 [Bacillus bombysepticus]MCU5276233.1 hypothetical protein [Bacillus cereus]PEA86100.1 hypothetical protein CON71_31955 [Bacillus thuringiensis]PRT22640.1 hypothetical protein C6351_31620 [Bacillus thuringiensis]
MKSKLLTALACSALFMGMTACGSNEKTTTESKSSEPAYKKEETKPKEKLAFQDMTTDQYLKNYNKIKDELAGQGIQILPFNLELEESTKTHRFYYTKEEDYGKTDTKWVSVSLRRDGKTIDSMLYNGAPDLNTIKAMIKATGLTWSDKLDKMVEGKESNKDSENIVVDGVRISIFGSPTDINVSIDAPPSI